jgi:hypothetical protein
VSHGFQAPVLTKTGTMAVIPAGKGKATIGANSKMDPSAINNAGFVAFLELLKLLTVTTTSPTKPSAASAASSQSPNYVLERLAVYFKDLLLKKDISQYERLVFESKVYFSSFCVLSQILFSLDKSQWHLIENSLFKVS